MMDEITSILLALLESLLCPTFSILLSLIFHHIFIISLISPYIDLLVSHGKQVKKIKRYIETKHGVLDWCKIWRMVWKIGCIKLASWCHNRCQWVFFCVCDDNVLWLQRDMLANATHMIWHMLCQTTKSYFLSQSSAHVRAHSLVHCQHLGTFLLI